MEIFVSDLRKSRDKQSDEHRGEGGSKAKTSCANANELPHPGETDGKIKINNSAHVLMRSKNISPSAIMQLCGVFCLVFFHSPALRH